MSHSFKKELAGKVAEALPARAQRQALLSAVKRGRDARAQALARMPGSASFRQEVREIKAKCTANLDDLLPRFVAQAEARGARVFLAPTGEAACRYVLDLARARNARLVVKSKSLTTEEIELNHPLEQAGLQVIETDLGERIIQMAGELPYHLVFPAVHKTAEQVAELFSRATGEPVSSDLADIMALMRRSLRPIFLNADLGITGANVAIAETGTVLIETNEGNGRLVSSIPPVQVCVMGREKIVETVDEALKMVRAHPVSAVGQVLTTYVSFMAGRAPLGDDGERELHIVILDNGREAMRADPWFREALHCIRCGACMNICPTYGVLGGHVFGHIYPGPIGIPWTACVHGLPQVAKFADLCISCGLCQEICPAEIDLPMLIAKVKQQALQLERQPLVNRVLMASETFARVACALAPVSNWVLQSRLVRWLNERLVGLDARRTLPRFQHKTFKKRFRNKQRSVKPGKGVVLFVDYFANYCRPELAEKAAALLQQAGLEVVLPPQKASGYPYISYGELEKARKVAAYNVRALLPHVEAGLDVVVLEPTATYALRSVYPKLLESEAAATVARKVYSLFEYLEKLQAEGQFFRLRTPPAEPRRYGYHLPCHQRGAPAAGSTVTFLQRAGFHVQVVETGTCCGMGGTFGLKKGALGYELSTTVGEPLFELFQAAGVDAIVTESSVCTMQLSEGTGLPVLHPLELCV